MKKYLFIGTLCIITLISGCKTAQRTVDTYPLNEHSVVITPRQDDNMYAPTQPSSVTTQDNEVLKENSQTHTPSTISKEQTLYNAMLQTYDTWETITARGSVSLGSLSSSFEMRMICNESIQISLRPIFGIEIARLIVTCDSIYIYDKINRRYIVNALTDLGDKIPFTPTISDIQNAMLGRPFILGNSTLSTQDFNQLTINSDNNDWTMKPYEQPDGIEYLFTFANTQLTSAIASQRSGNREVVCSYVNVNDETGKMLPDKITIKLKGSSKTYSLSTTYSSATWDSHVTIQHLSTQGYTRTNLSNLLKSLI